MGKIVTIEYVDDLEGGSLDPNSVDTVEFSYRGQDYSLVLSPENGARFDKDIARYIRAAKKAAAGDARAAAPKATRRAPRRLTKPKGAPQRKAGSRGAVAAVSGPERTRAIRQWAAANGHPVSARGRIAETVIDAYNAAH